MKRTKLFIITLLMVLSTMLFSGCAIAKMPVPSVKEGRFNFSFTYEINGEEKNYSGVYVCKYDGSYVSAFDMGDGVDWTAYVEGVGEEPEIAIHTNDDGVIYVGFWLYPGYFMADPNYLDYTPDANLFIVYHDDGPNGMKIRSDIDFMAEYGIRLISYTYDEPIENSYEYKSTFGRLDLNIN